MSLAVINSLIILIGLIFINIIDAKHHVAIQRLNIETDKSIIIMNPVLRQANGETVVDVAVEIINEIGTNAFIESEIFTKNEEDDGYLSFLKGSRLNACSFFSNRSLNPLLDLIMTGLNRYGNKINSCPIPKEKFAITGFRMDEDTIPSFVPAGQYRVEIKTTREVNGEFKLLYMMDCDVLISK